MSEPVPRLPRRKGAKQRIDWLALFREAEAGEACTVVADRYRVGGQPIKSDTLQKRYKRWKAAVAAGDETERRRTEGKETGRGVSNMSFTTQQEEELAGRIKAEKGEGAIITRQYVAQMAVEYYNTTHSHATRSVQNFAASSKWFSSFRLRNGFNTSKHKVRPVKPKTAVARRALEDAAVTFQLEVMDAIQHHGKHHVVNGDELFAKQVEHPSQSWGLVNEQNIVTTNLNKKNGITTTPFVSAAGDVLPTQVIARGKTRKCIDNRQLPPDLAGDFSPTGWQTEATLIRYIEQYLVPYLGPEGGTLILDEYSAHHTNAVRECLNSHYIDLIIVPPHMTHVLQPLDVGVIAQLRKEATKQYLAEQYDEKENRDPMGAAAVRIHTGWMQMDKGIIRHSFTDVVLYVPRPP